MPDSLCYCGNVHNARDLDELLASIESGPALVRGELGLDQLNYGLWLSETALSESIAEEHQRLRAALAKHRIRVSTMNAFPQGDFQAEVVKYEVYRPNWASVERLNYTLQCAELLAVLLDDSCETGTISTLPLGVRDALTDSAELERACENLCQAAMALATLATTSGKSIRICIEPEPGCYLETGADFIAFWQGPLARVAARMNASDAVATHLGMCLDTCHHALMFEDARSLVKALGDAQIPIGKIQLSSAIRIDPKSSESMIALRELDEKRFLHQVIAQVDGVVSACDDISGIDSLPVTSDWRVHFHVPIHLAEFSGLGTTQSFMREILNLVPSLAQSLTFAPQLEVETYTWQVMPEKQRPNSPESLAACIAAELRYAREALV